MSASTAPASIGGGSGGDSGADPGSGGDSGPGPGSGQIGDERPRTETAACAHDCVTAPWFQLMTTELEPWRLLDAPVRPFRWFQLVIWP